MAVKILIQRKVKPGKEKELNETVKGASLHGHPCRRLYFRRDPLCSIEDPSVHLVISTWKSLEDWNHWADSPERKVFQQKTDAMLEEPTKITPYQYESISPNMDEILTGLEFSVQDE